MKLSDYEEQCCSIFGEPIFRDLRNIKLHSIYPSDSKYFQKCYDALLSVEWECIEDIVRDLKKKAVNGAFAEFGIFQGAWIERLYMMTERVGLADRDIYGFDSFQGLSAPHPTHDVDFWKQGMYAASKKDVEQRLRTVERPRIKLVEGFFSDSLKSKQAQEIDAIAFARIDCDIYEPARQCLDYLSTRLTNNSILVFDDWTHDFEKGEGRAFAEWVPTVRHLGFQFLFMGPWDHLHIRVVHK